MVDKWISKWSNNKSVYDPDSGINLINDFAKVALEKNLFWRADEQSIYMPPWSNVENGTDNPAGQIKELANTEWSYFSVDWFNYANSTIKDPASWHADDWKSTPIRELFNTFVVESLKYVFNLAGKRSDDETVKKFIDSQSPGLIGANDDHDIQFGDYTIEARGNSEISNTVSPGLRFLVGIKTLALEQLPIDTHYFGGSPGEVKYEDFDADHSLKIKIGKIKEHFSKMAKILRFYADVRKAEPTSYLVPDLFVEEGGESFPAAVKKMAIKTNLNEIATQVEAFGDALAELADKSARTPITYFSPSLIKTADANKIDINNLLKDPKYKEDPDFYEPSKDSVNKPASPKTREFADLSAEQRARVVDKRFGSSENILEILFNKDRPDVFLVIERVPEKTFKDDVGHNALKQAGVLPARRLGEVRDSRILLQHLKSFKDSVNSQIKEANSYTMAIHFIKEVHDYTNGVYPIEFVNFLKNDDRESLLKKIDSSLFVKKYIYGVALIYSKTPDPEDTLKNLAKLEREKGLVQTDLQRNQHSDKISDPSWQARYEKYYSANAFVESSDAIMREITGGPTPLRVRLGSFPHPLSDVYKSVLNRADVKALVIQMVKCMAPDRWLELICRWIFENTPLGTMIDQFQQSGLLELLASAEKEFQKTTNKIMELQRAQKGEFLKLKNEKDQYDKEILRLSEELVEVEKEFKDSEHFSRPYKKYEKQIENLKLQMNDLYGRRQLVEMDEYSAKYNASLGARLPISHMKAKEAKEIAQEMASTIRDLQDPNLKDKICKNILKYAIEMIETISKYKDTVKTLEKGLKKPYRLEIPAWPELPSDPILTYARELMNQIMTQMVSQTILEVLKLILREIWKACMKLQDDMFGLRPDDPNRKGKMPGAGSFKDLLADDPPDAAATMCEILDKYKFDVDPSSCDDLLDFIKDLELLLSEIEICSLFKGNAQPMVVTIVRNLLKTKYSGIYEKLSPNQEYATNVAINGFFKRFESLLELGYCEDLTNSLMEADQNFACCLPLPAQDKARCDLQKDWLTEEELVNCLDAAEEERYNKLALALDLAAGKPPLELPPIFCNEDGEGIMSHDVEPLGFINEQLLNQIFHPIEASFRSDFQSLTEEYLKLARPEIIPEDLVKLSQEEAKDLLNEGVSKVIFPELKEDLEEFIPDILDLKTKQDSVIVFNEGNEEQIANGEIEAGANVEKKDKIQWVPKQGTFGGASFSENTYEIKIDNPFGQTGNIVYQLSPTDEGKYTIIVTWKDSKGDDVSHSFVVKSDGTVTNFDEETTSSDDVVLYSKSANKFAKMFLSHLDDGDIFTDSTWDPIQKGGTLTKLLFDAKKLFNSATISVIERFAFATAQSLFFDLEKETFDKIFSSMIPQQVFPPEKECFPKNDSSLIRIKAFKQYAKSRNKDISCMDGKLWPSATKHYNDMGHDPSSIAIATAEGIILTTLRLYSVEMIMRVFPMLFVTGFEGVTGEAVLEFITEMIIDDLKKIDERATPKINSFVHDKEPSVITLTAYKSARLGRVQIEDPPKAAVPPRTWFPSTGEMSVFEFFPKFPKHMIRYANQIMKNRTEKAEKAEGVLIVDNKEYPSSKFEDLFGLNGIKFLIKEQMTDVAKFFEEKVKQFTSAEIEDIRKMWLRMLEYKSLYSSQYRAGTSYLPVDMMPRALPYRERGRFFEYKEYAVKKVFAEKDRGTFVPTDFYDQLKGGGFILEPYIRAKLNDGVVLNNLKGLGELTLEEKGLLKQKIIDRRVKHYLKNPKLLDPNYELPQNYDPSIHHGPNFVTYVVKGTQEKHTPQPDIMCTPNQACPQDKQDNILSWFHHSQLGTVNPSKAIMTEKYEKVLEIVEELGLIKYKDELGNSAERTLIGFIWDNERIVKDWRPNGGVPENTFGIGAPSKFCPSENTPGWCERNLGYSAAHNKKLLTDYQSDMLGALQKLRNAATADAEQALNTFETFDFTVDDIYGDLGSDEGIYFNLQEWHDIFGTDAFALWLKINGIHKKLYTDYFDEWSYGLRLVYILPEEPGSEFSDGDGIKGKNIFKNIPSMSPDSNPTDIIKSKKAYKVVEKVIAPNEWYTVDFNLEEGTIEEQIKAQLPGIFGVGGNAISETEAHTHISYEIPFVEVETPVAGGLNVEIDYFTAFNAWENFPHEELYKKMTSSTEFNELFYKFQGTSVFNLLNISSLMTFYILITTLGLPQFEKMFLDAKLLLRKNFYTVLNAQEYDEDPNISSSEAAAISIPNIFGSLPMSPAEMLAMTPIKIIKGVADLIDPNWKNLPWTPAGWIAYAFNMSNKNPWFSGDQDKKLDCPPELQAVPPEDKETLILKKAMTENGVLQSTQDLFFDLFKDEKEHPITKALLTILKNEGENESAALADIFDLLDEYVQAYKRMADAQGDFTEETKPIIDDSLTLRYHLPKNSDESWPLVPKHVMWGDKGGISKFRFGALLSQSPKTPDPKIPVISKQAQSIILREVIKAWEYDREKYFGDVTDLFDDVAYSASDISKIVPKEASWGPLPLENLQDHIHTELIKAGQETFEATGEAFTETTTFAWVEKLFTTEILAFKGELMPGWQLKTPEHLSQFISDPTYVLISEGKQVGSIFPPEGVICEDPNGCKYAENGWKLVEESESLIVPTTSTMDVPYKDYLYWDDAFMTWGEGWEAAPGFMIQAMTAWNNLKKNLSEIQCEGNVAEMIKNYDWCVSLLQLQTALQYFQQVAEQINIILQDNFDYVFGEGMLKPANGNQWGVGVEKIHVLPIAVWQKDDKTLADIMLPVIERYFEE